MQFFKYSNKVDVRFSRVFPWPCDVNAYRDVSLCDIEAKVHHMFLRDKGQSVLSIALGT